MRSRTRLGQGWLVVLAWLVLAGMVSPVFGDQARGPAGSGESQTAPTPPLWGEALLNHPLLSLPSKQPEDAPLSQARRLVSNFNLQEETEPIGRLQARERLDGTREHLLYSRKNGWVEVWVTSQDGKFQEERLYQEGRLQAVLLVDGSLRTLQYVQPFSPGLAASGSGPERALTVVEAIRQRTRILEYDCQGKLLAGYLPDGTKIPTQAQPAAKELKRIINPDLMRRRFSGH